MRPCVDCQQTKPLEDFPKNGSFRRTRCRPCYRVYNTDNKRSVYEPNRNRELGWIKKFNLTIEDYNRMLSDQNGGCAICGQKETAHNRYGPRKYLSVDHDHSCCPGNFSCGNCVRGLLCHKCNVGIGMLNDDVSRLQNAIKYLGGEEQ